MAFEPKWTRGPWRVEQDTTLVWGNCNPVDTTNYGMGYPIVECHITPSANWAKGPSSDEGRANADLTSAAPEMYPIVALVASFPIQDGAPDDVPVFGLDGVYITHGDVRKARAALRKARGCC